MSDDMFAGLEEVRKSYLGNLIKESEDLLKTIKQASPSDIDEKLHIFAHKIYGSGASYGFNFITETGEAISIALNQDEDQGKAVTLIESMIKELENTSKNFA